jgi:ferredoxin-nitrate reductase
VIGGGLLGLEAARGLIELGVQVTVVHLVDRLMETQLDGPAARLLARRMRRLGAEITFGRVTQEVLGNGRVEGLRFADGAELEADLVVVAAGIEPDVALAGRSGLELGRGILVDDEMRTSAPGVWAVGECAEHRGTVYGIWAPLADQARTAGATIAGAPAAFHGTMPATTLKVVGAELFCAGTPNALGDDEDEIVVADGRSDVYRKLVLRNGELAGAILVGDTSLSGRLDEVARSGELVSDDVLAELTATGPTAAQPGVDRTLVCTCNAVSRADILQVARDRDLRTVEAIGEATRATTGCGSCIPDVRGLLDELERERADDLRFARLTRR